MPLRSFDRQGLLRGFNAPYHEAPGRGSVACNRNGIASLGVGQLRVPERGDRGT